EKDDIYTYIGANFSEEFLNSIQTPLCISDKFYNKKSRRKATKFFDTMRDYSKVVMLEFLYCSVTNKKARYKEIKRILPKDIITLAEELKSVSKSIFPIFLQNIEANLIIDQITKEIALINPELPMYTI